MTFSEDEKKLARSLTGNAAFMALIEKVMRDVPEAFDASVLDKTNAELGELVKANVLANEKIAARLSKLKQLGTPPGKVGKVAPK